MKSITILVEKRNNVGKKFTRSLRKIGKVPCVVYSNGETFHFSTPLSILKHIVDTPETYTVIIEWKEGGRIETILKDVQLHPISDIILHADFLKLQENKPIVVEIPVKIIGRSIGIAQGGQLYITLRKLKIRTILKNFPDYIEIDITSIGIGGKILVKDLLTDRYSIQHPNETLILAIKSSREVEKISKTEKSNNE
ncbi:50S ribosomal protein L25 [Candidatus Walczuchella endosymbiont of Icerya purchasi]|uniref:50S ribosomal protein L25 n=1 Tax=Candidatus Walczuchella endosymbiont of Icerya purchasi TaxID=3066219 RepID=UPI00313CD9EF